MMPPPKHDGSLSASDAFHASPFTISAATDPSSYAPAQDQQNTRLASVVRAFVATFPTANANTSNANAVTHDRLHVAVAPGRVNLIGEHIDYEGYSVLPMAIVPSMAVAATVTLAPLASSSHDHAVLSFCIANTNPNYPPATLSLPLSLLPPHSTNKHALFDSLVATLDRATYWVRYVLCGFLAAVDDDASSFMTPCTVHMLVDGTIPPACGLSSSSALVVASALALAASLGHPFQLSLPSRTHLAERCRLAEHYVGTAGGGMDQAVSCLATRDAALFVSFTPALQVEHVPLPPSLVRGNIQHEEAKEAVFLVVNSGVQAHKAEAAALRFNKRVVECALATKLLGKRLGVAGWETMTTLMELQYALQSKRGRPQSFNELLESVALIRDRDEVSRDDLAAELSPTTPLHELFSGSRLEKAATEVLSTESRFRLWQRVRHVWSEADRVLQFRQLLLGVANASSDDVLHRLGALMLASHKSCRDDYDCSCVELDTIVETATRAGAYGARLTGAGWGGCAVVLVARDRVEALRATLEADVFKGTVPEGAMVETSAADGARLAVVVDD